MSFVADTDVLIDFLRGRGDYIQKIEHDIRSGRLFTSCIAAAELWSAVKSPNEKATIEALLAALTILPIDATAAEHAGHIRQNFSEKKIAIGMAEALVAGMCLARDAHLITQNKKLFSKVPGLKIA